MPVLRQSAPIEFVLPALHEVADPLWAYAARPVAVRHVPAAAVART